MENIEKHFCVSVYVYDKTNKKFLLVHHKKLGVWVQPGGHVELNESPEEAAIREVYEETGINVNPIKHTTVPVTIGGKSFISGFIKKLQIISPKLLKCLQKFLIALTLSLETMTLFFHFYLLEEVA